MRALNILRLGIALACLCTCLPVGAGESADKPALVEIFVSPAGDDASPGTKEKPVAHLMKAVELSRAAAIDQPRRVALLPGEYYDAAVTLTAADSNLTIESATDAKATLIGGVRLSGWEKDGERFYAATLPSDRTWDIRLLQVNGRFCARARFPEKDALAHLSVFDVPWMSTTGGGWKRKPTVEELTTLKFKQGDLPADLDTRSAEVTVFHMWDESVAGIAQCDPASQTLKVNPALGHPPGAFGVNKYCLWNIAAGMTQPGQWYFDRTRGRIVYWPLPGEDMAHAEAIVPTQRTIVRVHGAKNVTLRNFSAAVTTVPLVTGGFAAAAFDGAIQLDSAEGAVLSNLTITNVAGHAIKAMHAQSSTQVENCQIAGCGAGGVYIAGANNRVHNNLIHDVGLMFPSAIGINGGGKDSTLSNNEIYDTSYSAVDFGGENIVIEHNLIHHCMKVLHDGAAIYVFAAKNLVMRGNVARDIIDTGGYGASAYYLDERSEDCVVEGNISINVARPSHNHMAKNNTIRNNVFINDGDLCVTFPRSSGFTMQGNVFYATGKVTFEGVNNVTQWSKNVIFSGVGKIDGVNLNDYAHTNKVPGVAGDTLAADPLFVDRSKLDLHYKPESPAVKWNLKPLDMSQAGRK